MLPIFNLMRHGYGAKVSYDEISTKMCPHVTNNAKYYTKDMCRDIFLSMHCSSNSFKLGQAHIFFRHKNEFVVEKFRALDTEETKKIAQNVTALFKFRQRHSLWILLRFIGSGKILYLFTLLHYIAFIEFFDWNCIFRIHLFQQCSLD